LTPRNWLRYVLYPEQRSILFALKKPQTEMISSEDVAAATAEFLAKGGKIQRLRPSPEVIGDSNDPDDPTALLPFEPKASVRVRETVLLPQDSRVDGEA